jgi:metallophosphoesterase (TIGR00282 family)
MNVLSDNPFLVAKNIIEKIKNQVNIIVIDFHAEATAEKIAMSYYLDGDATIVFGTHTHVQTADEKILPNGTAYITDIGMTGPKNSVIGMNIQSSLKRFETTLPEKYKLAEGNCIFNGVIFDIDDETNKVVDVKSIQC